MIPAKSWRCSSAQLTAASYPATQSLPPAPPVGCWRRPVACDEVDLVLFFRDPLKAESGSSSEQNLLRLCDMHSVPISTNIATAEVLLRGLDQGDLDYREGIHPDIVEPLPVHRAVC